MTNQHELRITPDIDPGLARRIGNAARQAYQAVASGVEVDDFMNEPIPYGTWEKRVVWRMPVCNAVAKLLVGALRDTYDASIEQQDLWWDDGRKSPRFLNFHQYVTLPFNGRTIIVDSTWQQFFKWQSIRGGNVFMTDDALAEMPQVLVGTREEIVAQAKQYGISDPGILALWEKPGHAPHADEW